MDVKATCELGMPLDAAMERFVDEDFNHWLFKHMGFSHRERLHCEPRGPGFDDKIRYVPAFPIPEVAKKLLAGRRLGWDETRQWRPEQRLLTSKITPHVFASSVNIAGTVAFEPKGERTLQHFDFKIEVKIPLVGGILERIIAGDTRNNFVRSGELFCKYEPT